MERIKISVYRKLFYDTKIDKIALVSRILNECPCEDILRYYKNTPIIFKGVFRKALNYLLRNKYSDVYRGAIYANRNPLDYFGWATFVLGIYKEKINKYVEWRNIFEDAYLQANYDECLRVLNTCNNDISYSFWAASNTIRIADLTNGIDCRVKVYNEIAEGTPPAMDVMCSISQELASITTSSETIIEEHYNNICNRFKNQWEVSFLTAHCFSFRHEPLGNWISFDMRSSLIDVYAFLLLNLHKYCSIYKNNKLFKQYLSDLCSLINDDRLTRYLALINGRLSVGNKERTELICKLDNNIIEGNKENAIDYIYNNPSDMDFAFAFLQCIIRNNVEFVIEKGNLQKTLLDYLYNFLKRKDSASYRHEIFKICHTNPTLFSFRQLYEITQFVELNAYQNEYRYIWHYSYCLNAYDALFFDLEEDRTRFICAENRIVYQERLDYFRLMLCESKLKKNADKLRTLFDSNLLPVYQKTPVAQFLYDNYIEDHNFKEAILFFLQIWFNPNKIIVKVDTLKLETLLSKDVEVSMNMPLELSVFYSIINANFAKVQDNIIKYLKVQNVNVPSEINVTDNPLVIYFLEKVVDRKMLELCPMFFSPEDEVLEERLKICRNLKSVIDKKEYNAEINAIIKEQEILKFLKVVDSSKIYVDESNLKKYELLQAEDLYYQVIATDRKIEILLSSSHKLERYEDAANEDMKETQIQRQKIKYRYVLFKRFFLLIRDQFLLNEHAGLDYFLSSRVRHGTIVNQLRHHFQEYKLTTLKNGYNQYDINSYWATDRLHLIGEDWVKCTEYLLKFTKNVDELIISLKDHAIQVRTENHKSDIIEACFDYTEEIIQPYIISLYECDYDYETCVDCIIYNLWDHAESCFEKVKNAVQKTEMMLKAEMDTLLDNILKLPTLGKEEKQLFRESVTHCKQSISTDIEDILGWFQRRPSSEYDFTFDQLISASTEGINKINEVPLLVETEILTTKMYSGSVLNTFYDLFHNLFCNIVEYATSKGHKANCRVLIEEKSGFLHIVVSNTIMDDDIQDAQESIDRYLNNRCQRDRILSTRGEGESGMAKNDSIIYYQLRGKDNSYTPKIENGEYIVDINVQLGNIIAL